MGREGSGKREGNEGRKGGMWGGKREVGREREGGMKREGWKRGMGRGRKGSGKRGREGESHGFQFGSGYSNVKTAPELLTL